MPLSAPCLAFIQRLLLARRRQSTFLRVPLCSRLLWALAVFAVVVLAFAHMRVSACDQQFRNKRPLYMNATE
jgi:hypothetical protein